MNARKNRRVFPPIGGGQDLDEVLKTISGQLSALGEREAKGENVAAEKAQLEAEKAQAEAAKAAAAAAPPEDELARLRREKQERDEREAAQRYVEQAMKAVAQTEAERQERIQAYVNDALQKALGGQNIETAVMDVLKHARQPSRAVGQHASAEYAQKAAGGFTLPGQEVPRVEVGQDRGYKALKESRNLTKFVSALVKVKEGVATDGERQFIIEQRQKALTEGTGTAGGVLVPAEWMDDILPLLRAQAVVRAANPRIQPFNKLMNQTQISSGATAYYIGEGARITPSEPTFAEVPLLSPKNLTGLVPVSNFLIWDDSGVEDIVRADLTEVLALREDLAFIQGSGGTEPTGLKNLTGVTSNPIAPGANGFQPTLKQMRAILGRTRTLNAANPRWTWFFAPQFITYLEGLEDTTGRPLLERENMLQINDDQRSGRFLGVPFFTTTQIPVNLTQGTSTNATYVLLVDVSEVVIGINRDLELSVSDTASYSTDGTTWRSAFQQNETLFKAIMRHDINSRRPAHVLVQNGVLV